MSFRSYQSGLSWELADAPRAANAQWRVYYWIRKNAPIIARAERRYKVDGVAIAGVIAYEALEDIHPVTIRPLARYVGPGKVHFKEFRFSEGLPMAKVVEEQGYLPRRTLQQRAAILSTDAGAVEYIAAIMATFAAFARAHDYTIRCDPDILATFYSAWTLREAEARFSASHAPLAPNRVGTWIAVQRHFLLNALQSPEPSFCNSRTSH